MVNQDIADAIGVNFGPYGSYDNALGRALIERALGKKIFTVMASLDPAVARYQLDRNLPVSGAIPTLISYPVLSGTINPPVVPEFIYTSNGVWTDSPTSYSYQWVRDGVPITDATGQFYQPVPADSGLLIWALVTATNAAGSSVPAPSEQIGPVQ
jgi:hypothetical protein